MRRFGLIGRPLGHSASAAYFAAKFAREGIGDALYELYELPAVGELPSPPSAHSPGCWPTIPISRDST